MGEKQRERESQADSTLSTEPDRGLGPSTLRSQPELKPKVGCFIDWASRRLSMSFYHMCRFVWPLPQSRLGTVIAILILRTPSFPKFFCHPFVTVLRRHCLIFLRTCVSMHPCICVCVSFASKVCFGTFLQMSAESKCSCLKGRCCELIQRTLGELEPVSLTLEQ